ncbi:MAG: helix-turn-helix transcriptional regulator [Bacillales bacterium]|nr:helix-turn-helix transcriptional regulator [Bacillales bacterium]
MIGQRLKELRGKKTQAEIAEQIGISRARYSHYENGRNNPDVEIIKKLAEYYGVSIEHIIGVSEDKYDPNQLTQKEIHDIEKDLDKMINNLSNNGYSHFGGEGLDELDAETKEAIINSLRSSLIMARKLAKEKFTPKKYRK